MSTTSLSLLEQLATDPTDEAWARLYEVYAPLLKQWLARYDIQAADADDVTQEVLATLIRELPNFQHNQQTGAFRRWLKQTLVNRVREHWRRRQPHSPLTGRSSLAELAALEDDKSWLSAVWDRQHDDAVINSLLALVRPRFDERTWAAFRRQMLDGVPATTVAAEMEMKITSVWAAKSRVLKALRDASRGLIEDS